VARTAWKQRAEDPRARLGVGQRAVRGLDLDAESVGQRGEPPLARERSEAPGSATVHSDRRWAIRCRPARTPGAGRGGRRRRVADEHAAVQLRDSSGNTISPAGASSTIAW